MKKVHSLKYCTSIHPEGLTKITKNLFFEQLVPIQVRYLINASGSSVNNFIISRDCDIWVLIRISKTRVKCV
jgi:hypothetical protein